MCLVGWNGRTRQDELARRPPTIVHSASHVIPQSRRNLPLVDEAGLATAQEKFWLDF
jgi:hypothetical protein